MRLGCVRLNVIARSQRAQYRGDEAIANFASTLHPCDYRALARNGR